MRLGLLLFAGALAAQTPVFFSWHQLEFEAYRDADRDVTAILHFRTSREFSAFNTVRGSVVGRQRLPKALVVSAGYLIQDQEPGAGDGEWLKQQRVFASIQRTVGRGKLRHTPRAQYDYLFDMSTAAYARYRFAWVTEWAGRVRPYGGAEEFFERAGAQRFRPRAGVRFAAGRYLDADVGYIYDRIYLRGNTNRHILQTTFSFHRAGRD
jgi:hypothetical protein